MQFSDSSSDLDYSPINISPEEAKVENVPIKTVRGIWIKARDLLKTPETVISGPQLTDQDPQTIVVASKSSTKPRIISHTGKGFLFYESTCPNWVGIRICSHSVAAAFFVLISF